MTRFSRILAALAAAFLGGAVALPGPARAQSPGCLVQYQVISQSSTSFAAQINLINLGNPTAGWNLQWQMNPGEQLGLVWGAVMGQSGTWIAATNVAGAAPLATGGGTNFGWTASLVAPTVPPTAFWMNGMLCLAPGKRQQ
jgi:endoglucanase